MTLYMFYGEECPHCEKMMPVVEEVESEKGVEIERLEVWHDKENAEKMQGIEEFEECGGVPFFYNTETGQWICGEAGSQKLADWAAGEQA
jgi:thiol-disulfide isomerase/thioredoxin